MLLVNHRLFYIMIPSIRNRINNLLILIVFRKQYAIFACCWCKTKSSFFVIFVVLSNYNKVGNKND